jgi:GntR family transcriptional regulator
MDDSPGSAPVHAGVPEHGRVPKYFGVRARLEVLLDELGEDGRLPTERELAESFAVSRETVRQALRDLLIQGRLRRRGRGTVVAGPKLEQPLSLVSYTEGVRRQGRTPGRSLIGLDRLQAGRTLGEQLRIPATAEVWHLERVLLADGERVGLESLYVPTARFPDLGRDFTPDSSFYGYARDRVGERFSTAEERIETVLVTPREAQLIGVPPALPMLLLHRASFDRAGAPIERVRSLFRGDRFSFTTSLSHRDGPW